MDTILGYLKDVCSLLLNNEVIVPVFISVLLFHRGMKKQTRTEEDENFITLKKELRDLWGTLRIKDPKALYNELTDKTDSQVALAAFNVVDFLYSVWFLNFKNKSRYQKQWEHNISHILSKPLIVSTFKKHESEYDNEFSEFINKMII